MAPIVPLILAAIAAAIGWIATAPGDVAKKPEALPPSLPPRAPAIPASGAKPIAPKGQPTLAPKAPAIPGGSWKPGEIGPPPPPTEPQVPALAPFAIDQRVTLIGSGSGLLNSADKQAIVRSVDVLTKTARVSRYADGLLGPSNEIVPGEPVKLTWSALRAAPSATAGAEEVGNVVEDASHAAQAAIPVFGWLAGGMEAIAKALGPDWGDRFSRQFLAQLARPYRGRFDARAFGAGPGGIPLRRMDLDSARKALARNGQGDQWPKHLANALPLVHAHRVRQPGYLAWERGMYAATGITPESAITAPMAANVVATIAKAEKVRNVKPAKAGAPKPSKPGKTRLALPPVAAPKTSKPAKLAPAKLAPAKLAPAKPARAPRIPAAPVVPTRSPMKKSAPTPPTWQPGDLCPPGTHPEGPGCAADAPTPFPALPAGPAGPMS